MDDEHQLGRPTPGPEERLGGASTIAVGVLGDALPLPPRTTPMPPDSRLCDLVAGSLAEEVVRVTAVAQAAQAVEDAAAAAIREDLVTALGGDQELEAAKLKWAALLAHKPGGASCSRWVV